MRNMLYYGAGCTKYACWSHESRGTSSNFRNSCQGENPCAKRYALFVSQGPWLRHRTACFDFIPHGFPASSPNLGVPSFTPGLSRNHLVRSGHRRPPGGLQVTTTWARYGRARTRWRAYFSIYNIRASPNSRLFLLPFSPLLLVRRHYSGIILRKSCDSL